MPALAAVRKAKSIALQSPLGARFIQKTAEGVIAKEKDAAWAANNGRQEKTSTDKIIRSLRPSRRSLAKASRWKLLAIADDNQRRHQHHHVCQGSQRVEGIAQGVQVKRKSKSKILPWFDYLRRFQQAHPTGGQRKPFHPQPQESPQNWLWGETWSIFEEIDGHRSECRRHRCRSREEDLMERR